MSPEPPRLTERFDRAVRFADRIHGEDERKGTRIPYMAHLLVVTGLVLEDGGDEDVAIGAMLHDAVEDGEGRKTLEEIRAQFGERVAHIVEGCSDTLDPGEEKAAWKERKLRYLASLPGKDEDTLRVSLADKVHNARSIVRDYREEGERLWKRLRTRSARDQLWYYGGLLNFFEECLEGPLVEDLRRTVGELAWLVARHEAKGDGPLRVWLDDDLHDRTPPEPGWVQVRTAGEAIALLRTGRVVALSLDHDLGEETTGRDVVKWLMERSEVEDRDLWPQERIAIHSANWSYSTEAMAGDIDRYSGLKRSGPREWRAESS
jgi:hypothetical protein